MSECATSLGYRWFFSYQYGRGVAKGGWGVFNNVAKQEPEIPLYPPPPGDRLYCQEKGPHVLLGGEGFRAHSLIRDVAVT